MSLFENSEYRWRETCFVMFDGSTRPQLQQVQAKLDGQFELGDSTANEQGELETLTVYSPHDFSAMDIHYVDGDDVTETMEDLLSDLKQNDLDEKELAKLADIANCSARLDVLHFERVIEPAGEDEFLDPGSLLLVLEGLAQICRGTGVDPQSGTIL